MADKNRNSDLILLTLVRELESEAPTAEENVIACPHCCRKVRLSHKSETVAVLSRRFLRQSHFSATVWTGL